MPRELARRIRVAAAPRKGTARTSVIALGLALAWLSRRAPGRTRTTSTLAGLPLRHLASLTRRADGRAYSVSAIAHKVHNDDGRETDTGFLPALQAAGVLTAWLPPAARCPEWMRGPRGYAFICIRARLDAWLSGSDAAPAPDVPPALLSLLATA